MIRIARLLPNVLLGLALLGVSSSFDQPGAPGTVIVVADVAHNRPAYKVNSSPVSYLDLLDRLSSVRAKWPAVPPKVILLAHEQLTLSQIDALRGIISKAGYERPRVFYFGKDKRLMIELTYSPAIPFSEKKVPPGQVTQP